MNTHASGADNLFNVEASLTGRFWTLATPSEAAIRDIASEVDGDDTLARLLALRGVTRDKVQQYLNPTLRELFPDPFSFADMEKAAELVLDAILDGRPVTVFADYDVDGGTSSALLSRYFRAWGRELGLYVPDRLKEGYGPSPEAFQTLKAAGAELVITVDCGAAAVQALETANKIDLPVIVLDHHLMQGVPPPNAALVNPNRPDDVSGCGHLAAAGVVFVFLAAINRLARSRAVAPDGGLPDPLQWLDLCALGTLCDMSPLKGVNRAFVRQGLKVMSTNANPGLRALADVSGIGRIESVYHATFILGPRLNAGGRIGDPWLAAKLLATDDREEAIALSERLHALNDERKAVETAILDEATAQATATLERDPDRGVLIAGGEGWHPGVIGIVAGRLKDRFHLPSIVVGWGEGLGPVAKGSARSVRGVNIGDAIAAAAREGVILSGGGHAMAGGLSLNPEQLIGFEAWMTEHMSTFGEERAAALELMIDAVSSPGAATINFVDRIESLSPFGVGAPQPVFAMPNITVTGARRIGDNHMKFVAEDSGGRLECVAWRPAPALSEAMLQGAKLNIAGRLKADEWNGRRRVQMEIIDAAPS